MNFVYKIDKLGKAISKKNGFARQKFNKGISLSFYTFMLNVGNNGYFLQLDFRNLVVDIETPNRFHFIAKKIEPERIFIRKRKNIDNAPPNRKLTGLVNKIYPFKTVFIQKFVYKFNRKVVALFYLQGIGFESMF